MCSPPSPVLPPAGCAFGSAFMISASIDLSQGESATLPNCVAYCSEEIGDGTSPYCDFHHFLLTPRIMQSEPVAS